MSRLAVNFELWTVFFSTHYLPSKKGIELLTLFYVEFDEGDNLCSETR